ncbi:dimethylamine/trimethylamine dehydrogenase [Allocatelliglobosispora scoriae]|uniref:Dimethylamine/trimethylamine dehydrogenase n=1 Tax=Allocatelliglobosispora scoriae TaxID=643052 RepID=A0A841BPI2_9ACTN|nr:NAD(P)-binding protein [Allocatelliglobosispora scoriae]MBB5868741.1 dimethylamine/trimethylamine dehydrogenase [Allocatelliglobosispora scoriae]
MTRPAGYDILFEPLRIGPVVAKNRFFQVPHCNGMGRGYPSSMAAMRGIKAEGGWGVVCTEQCDVHYSGNHPRELRLWDDKDVPYLARATDLIHEHGSLAAIELAHNGFRTGNLESRAIPLAPSLALTRGIQPITARAMDKSDIRAARRWHRTAAINARRAGFDIVYVYAGHDMTLPVHFLSRRYNQRTDEYGGSLENRVRLLRELIEDAKEAVGDTCAVAVRFGVDELIGPNGITSEDEGRDVVEMLAELPDLWDVNISNFDNDGQTARFSAEGYQEQYVKFVKSATTKPVVGVGRFTSPDTMVAMIKGGTLDFIGAARPSIADPFLPRKIEEGRFDDIRECIGCNICVAGDKASVPMRCTQNPTMGEEWRRGWHPEFIPSKDTDDTIFIIGAGPAGLEAARALGQRGYSVLLAERDRELGGRVRRESLLPGLATWGRVRDWRLGQLKRMRNVQLLPGNEITADDVLQAEMSLVAIATGARWRSDGIGRHHSAPIPGLDSIPVFTPDDIMAGRLPSGRVVVFDDDHYYMAGVITELLVAKGCEVTFVTPESLVSAFTQFTTEQRRIQRRIIELCAAVRTSTGLRGTDPGVAHLACAYTGRETEVAADAIVLVTGSVPRDELYHELQAHGATALTEAGIRRVVRVGDCLGPGIIAAAVYSGHLFARTLDTDLTDWTPYRRENVELDWDQPLPQGASHG